MARCTTAEATRLLAPRSFDVVVVERHVFDFQAARESVVFFLVHLAYATYCGASSHGGVGGLASCQGGSERPITKDHQEPRTLRFLTPFSPPRDF